MNDWTPYVGAICQHVTTHCPDVIKPIPGPVRVMRLAGNTSCWIQPLGPVRVRQLRNGRQVRETPNYEALVGNNQLAPMPPNAAAAALLENHP